LLGIFLGIRQPLTLVDPGGVGLERATLQKGALEASAAERVSGATILM